MFLTCSETVYRQRRYSEHVRAFTLIETLVYLALFSFIIGGLAVAAYALFESGGRNQTKAMLQEERGFVMQKMLWALNNAKTIDAPLRGTSGSRLSITTYDGAIATVSTTTGDVYLNDDRLNNTDVILDMLRFTHMYDATSDADGVVIEIVAHTRQPSGMVIRQSASTTRYIRK